jgi:acyl CoA:acetate/3-ketoacid CoA transferase
MFDSLSKVNLSIWAAEKQKLRITSTDRGIVMRRSEQLKKTDSPSSFNIGVGANVTVSRVALQKQKGSRI